MYSPTWQSGRGRGINLIFPGFLQFLKQRVAEVICQDLMQFPLITLLTQTSSGAELACCSHSSSVQTTNFCEQWGHGNSWHPNPHFQKCWCLQGAGPHYNYSLSVCLSSWSTGALFMEGQVVLLAVLACLYFFAFLITYFWRYLQHDKITYLKEYPRNTTELLSMYAQLPKLTWSKLHTHCKNSGVC